MALGRLRKVANLAAPETDRLSTSGTLGEAAGAGAATGAAGGFALGGAASDGSDSAETGKAYISRQSARRFMTSPWRRKSFNRSSTEQHR